MNLIKAAVEQGGAEIITLALRRANTENKENILDFIPKGVTLLPNTSGARNAEEAVRIARLSREMGCGDFVKIEITRLILERFGQVDAIAGVATGAIPQGASLGAAGDKDRADDERLTARRILGAARGGGDTLAQHQPRYP